MEHELWLLLEMLGVLFFFMISHHVCEGDIFQPSIKLLNNVDLVFSKGRFSVEDLQIKLTVQHLTASARGGGNNL